MESEIDGVGPGREEGGGADLVEKGRELRCDEERIEWEEGEDEGEDLWGEMVEEEDWEGRSRGGGGRKRGELMKRRRLQVGHRQEWEKEILPFRTREGREGGEKDDPLESRRSSFGGRERKEGEGGRREG